MKITSVTIGFSVKELDQTAIWYKKVLGIREIILPKAGIAEMKAGPVWLQLFENETVPSDRSLRLGVVNLEKERQRLVKLGIKVEEITDIPGVIRYFDFADPHGNGLTFYTLYQE